jgi:hypothetical protein
MAITTWEFLQCCQNYIEKQENRLQSKKGEEETRVRWKDLRLQEKISIFLVNLHIQKVRLLNQELVL